MFDVLRSMSKKCVRSGCSEVFIHGRTIEYGPEHLCMSCSNEFIKILDEDEQQRDEYGRPRKNVEQDLKNFLKTNKGETFVPSVIAPEDMNVSAHSIFYKKRVEILDPDPTSFDLEMEKFDEEIRRSNEEYDMKFKTHQDNTRFVTAFREQLSKCSDETLAELMRCGQFHTIEHDIDCDCFGNEEGDEICHNTRGLGKVWLAAVLSLEAE